MSPTQMEEENKEEAKNKPRVLNSGASAHYHPTAFDKESPNNGRSSCIVFVNGSEVHSSRQGNTTIVIAEFKTKLNEALLSVGTLVQQQEHPADLLTQRVNSDSRITQIYAKTTSHIRPEQPSPTQIRLSAAGT